MAYEINKEEKTVSVKKDCKTCTHIKVCTFHKKISDICKTNEFYLMVDYPEWNNSLAAFEKHSRCQFYTYTYKIPEDKTITIECDPDIIHAVLSGKLREYGSDYLKKDEASFNPIDGSKALIKRKVSEVLLESDFRFK